MTRNSASQNFKAIITATNLRVRLLTNILTGARGLSESFFHAQKKCKHSNMVSTYNIDLPPAKMFALAITAKMY